MNSNYFITQLEKRYLSVLRGITTGTAFEPIVLWGGKNKPETTVQLHEAIQQFQLFEKGAGKLGWKIEWADWSSKKFGNQKWPAKIEVQSIEDYIFLLGKEKELDCFECKLKELKQWNSTITKWLAEHPDVILRYLDSWEGICNVVDYFTEHDTSGHYLRSLPIPVHTKFIENHEWAIVSILNFLLPDKFGNSHRSLEKLAGLLAKPYLFTLRWLDKGCGIAYGFPMEVFGLQPSTLQEMNWEINEIWLVENETALYMLPERENALAIWTRGKAIALLEGIAFLKKGKLLYWGDMDEDGFFCLSQCRAMYPNVMSCFMDVYTLKLQMNKMRTQPSKYIRNSQSNLLESETIAYEILYKENGRIEQEHLPQKFISEGVKLIK